MADYYVYSSAGGSADGSSWANAFTSLKTAMESPRAAGDRFFVAHDHNETGTANITLTSPGTKTNPQIVLCVNRAGSVPPVQADLQSKAGLFARTSTGSMTINGSFYCEGLIIASATGIQFSASNGDIQLWKNCKFQHTGSSGNLLWGGTSVGQNLQEFRAIGCDFDFANASPGILPRGGFLWEWFGGSVTTTGPTNLFGPGSNSPAAAIIRCRDLDLSLIGSSKFLVNEGNLTGSPYLIEFERCKLSGSLGGVITGTIGADGGLTVDLFNCDSGTGTYREERYRYSGSIKQETTIVRSGGASDGTTSKSWKLVSLSGASKILPLRTPDIWIWVDTTGSHTFALDLVTDNVTLKDTEFWIELEYMGDAATPLGTFDDSTFSGMLATGANLTTSSVTWTTTGLTTPAKQKVSKTVTINEKGYVLLRGVLAKASTTVYVDPYPTVT